MYYTVTSELLSYGIIFEYVWLYYRNFSVINGFLLESNELGSSRGFTNTGRECKHKPPHKPWKQKLASMGDQPQSVSRTISLRSGMGKLSRSRATFTDPKF